MTQPSERPISARRAAADALTRAAEQFPDLTPSDFDPADYSWRDPRDARLALAIVRGALQRWLTIEHLLNRFLRQPMCELEPALQAILLSAGAQLLFMDRLPTYSIIDESVTLAKRMVRPKAGALVNAVLRRLAELIQGADPLAPWTPAKDRLPAAVGGVILNQPCLPDPDDLPAHLSAACSCPAPLIRRWLASFGQVQTIELALHGVKTPPIIVVVEDGFSPDDEQTTAHQLPGFACWRGSRDQLTSFLSAHSHRRVQDPGACRAVAETASPPLQCIVDLCAGMGTKTKQLVALHPKAEVIASDVDVKRLRHLKTTFADQSKITVAPLDRLSTLLSKGGADLVLVDAPCSNTAALARRPEARYRFDDTQLQRLVRLQRTILTQARSLVRPGGRLLYSTCSLEAEENQQQTQWLLKQGDLQLVKEQLNPPGGVGETYHDGGYYVIVR